MTARKADPSDIGPLIAAIYKDSPRKPMKRVRVTKRKADPRVERWAKWLANWLANDKAEWDSLCEVDRGGFRPSAAVIVRAIDRARREERKRAFRDGHAALDTADFGGGGIKAETRRALAQSALHHAILAPRAGAKKGER